jgi:hypothetical protein
MEEHGLSTGNQQRNREINRFEGLKKIVWRSAVERVEKPFTS